MTYSLIDGKVVREDGYVGMQHRNTNPTSHKIGKVVYSFVPRHNVSLCWVAPEHVQQMLSEVAQICCGKTSKKFFLAGIVNVGLHETGSRDE